MIKRSSSDITPQSPAPASRGIPVYEDLLNRDSRWALSEGSRHFAEDSAVFRALHNIAGRLKDDDEGDTAAASAAPAADAKGKAPAGKAAAAPAAQRAGRGAVTDLWRICPCARRLRGRQPRRS